MLRERYATVREAAQLLDVSPDTIRGYEARGVLPPAMRSPANGYRLWPREQLLEACERLRPQRRAVSA